MAAEEAREGFLRGGGDGGNVHPLQALPELSPSRPGAEKSKERSSSGAWVSAELGKWEPAFLPTLLSVSTADPHRVSSFSVDGDV